MFELYKKYHIPYVLDFRDLWNTRIIEEKYTPEWLERMQDKLCTKYWKKWSKYALFSSITSEIWLEKLAEIVVCKGKVIRNGFEEAHFLEHRTPSSERFIVLHCGSLYYHQDLSAFVAGVKAFLRAHVHTTTFEIHFIGAYKATYPKSSTAYMSPQDIDTMLAPISQVVHMFPRCSKEEAARRMQEAAVLLMPAFPQHRGTYSAKIFDYLGSERPILLTPADSGLLSALIRKEQAGYIASTPEEVSQFLAKAYKLWKKEGHYTHSKRTSSLTPYSRRYQVHKMAQYIDEALAQS